MKKLMIVVGLLPIGAILWANYGHQAKTKTAETLRQAAHQVEK